MGLFGGLRCRQGRVTDDQLQERLQYWRVRLRLQDWHIIVRFADDHVLKDNVRGNCIAYWSSKSAHINIRPKAIYPYHCFPSNPVNDEEEALVHELLHVHFSGFEAEDGTPEDDLHHQAINALAVALVEEHRLALADAKDEA
jgi:hypothetical protein